MTFFWKYIFPPVWLGGFGIGTIGAISTLGINGVPFLIGLIFGFGLIYYVCIRAKKVDIDDNFLYISNFRENIQLKKRVSRLFGHPLFCNKYVAVITELLPHQQKC